MGPSQLYIGLMSGTSADGVDSALVEFHPAGFSVLASATTPMPPALQAQIESLLRPGDNEIYRAGILENGLARLFAECALAVAGDLIARVHAIGVHGQTIRHHPEAAFTVQICNPSLIAELTNTTVVADFRRRDMAAGGQGAPLAPAFHRALLSGDGPRAVLNLGGIANVSLLPSTGGVTGFDTGPANTLLDAWSRQNLSERFDRNGAWAAAGRANEILLRQMLTDPFFSMPPPKSTGREYFHLEWLNRQLEAISEPINPKDVQATLVELTASSVADAIHRFGSETREVLVCGGGAHNDAVMAALHRRMPEMQIAPSDRYGVDADFVEAIGFAWLARETLAGRPGNVPEVTGARGRRVLGGVYPP